MSAISLTLSVILFPVVAVTTLVQICWSKHTTWYSSPSAMLGVNATREGWLLPTHLSKRPGSGAGRHLRNRVFPVLTNGADAAGIPIYGSAADDRLAETYCREMPGLRVTGRAPLGRVTFRREPTEDMT